MKTYFFTAVLVVLTLFTGLESRAQERDNPVDNYVVLTKKVPQLQPILITAEKLKEDQGDRFGEFIVVICGQEIGDITDPEKIDKFLLRAEELGVKLVACGFSLNKFKVSREAVPKSMEIVENGILYNFQLQQKGYFSLSL